MLSDTVGAYYAKILICTPMSRYRRGVLLQNPYLRPDGTTTSGRITPKFLFAPRCTKVEGIIDLILSHIPASAKTSGYNQPGFASYTLVRVDQRVYRPGFVSYTLVCEDQRVYRLGFVFHTLARKFFRVQIAWIRSQYPRPHKYIKILTGRYLRCPSVFLSVNIYFINDLLQPVCLHVLELLQHFF